MKTSPSRATQHPGELLLRLKRPNPGVQCATGTGDWLVKLTLFSGGIEHHVEHFAKTPDEMHDQSILQVIR